MTTSIVLGSRAEDRVTFGISPLSEMTTLLHALSLPGHHPAQRLRLLEIREHLPLELARRLQRLVACGGAYRCRALFVGPGGFAATLGEELDGLGRLPREEFLRFAAWGVSGGYSNRGLDFAADPDGAGAELLQRTAGRGVGALTVAEQLLEDVDKVRETLVATLEWAADCFFLDEWELRYEGLAEDASQRSLSVKRDGVAAVLARLYGPSEVRSGPERVEIDELHTGTVPLDRQPLFVMPSVYIAPHVLIKHEGGWPAILQYTYSAPCTTRSFHASDVQRRLAVLSDPGYLRLARILAAESLATVEIARRFGADPTHVSRQLRTFRQLGLVKTFRERNYVYYTLNLEEIARLGTDLLDVMLR